MYYESKFLSIAISAALIAYYISSKKNLFFRYHPSYLFCLFWGIFIFVPETLLFKYRTNVFSVLFIATFSVVLTAPALLFKMVARTIPTAKFLFDCNRLFICSYILAAVSVFTTLAVVVQNGFSLANVLFNFMTTSGDYAAIRGNYGMDYGIVGVVNITSTYSLAAISGILFSSAIKDKIKALLLGFIPVTFFMMIQSQKLVFLISFGYFLGGFLCGLFILNKHLNLRILFKRGLICFFIAVLLLATSMVTRNHFHGMSVADDLFIEYLVRDFSNYFLAEIFSFSDFFTFYVNGPASIDYNTDSVYSGQYTFYSVYNIFGLGTGVLPSFFDEIHNLPDLTDSVQFTVFRGMIHDFGISGSLILAFFIGLLFQVCVIGVLRKRPSGLCIVLYISAISFTFFSYVLSLFMALFPFSVALTIYMVLKLSQIRTE